jgi:penicillin-binding protein 1A
MADPTNRRPRTPPDVRPVPKRQKTPREVEAAPARPKRAKTPREVYAVSNTPPPKKKKPKVDRPPRALWWRIVRGFLLVGFGGFLVAVAGVVAVFLIYGADPDLPRLDRVGEYHPKLVTRVVDRDGELLGEIFDERRTVVPRNKISNHMIHAIVDAEDAQFYEHKGLNYYGMVRALVNNLQPGKHLQGASTITQQLVKTYLLKTNERTVKRKVQEVILARRIETELSKDEILTLYLNEIYLGHHRYGVEEASRFFFGKSVADVDPGEAALLASLPKGPEEISPLRHPERAKERQKWVLSRMVLNGHLSQADAKKYSDAPIKLVRQAATVGAAPEFVDEARKVLVERYGRDKLDTLGITVKTTCDARIEKLAREALEKQLESLDDRQGYRKPVAHAKSTTPAAVKSLLEERALRHLHSMIEHPTKAQRERWLEDRAGALAAGKVTEAVVVEVRTADTPPPSVKSEGNVTKVTQVTKDPSEVGVIVDGGSDRAFVPMPVIAGKHDRYNPKGLPVEKRFSVGDVIVVRVEPSLGKTLELPTAVPEFGPQAALVALDPQTREVRAIVGGYQFGAGGFDRAVQAKRQPGSSFKPFLYATAFQSGKYTPATVLNDSPQVYEMSGLKEWKPKNAESHEFLGPVRLRVALAKSLNTVASQLVYDLGPAPLAATAHAAGIESKLDETLALGLGASVVSLFELTNAYATFASGGKRAAPILLSAIGDEQTPAADAQQAIPPEIAYLVTSMMESVIDEGTAASAKGRLHRPAAGKTGTTSSERDAWFVGYTPDLVIGVWVGFDDMRDLGHGEQGARSALPIWIDAMIGAEKGVPPRPFQQPPQIVVARIDPATGLLAAPNATTAIDEKFLPGTAPTQVAPEKGEQNPDTFIMEQ